MSEESEYLIPARGAIFIHVFNVCPLTLSVTVDTEVELQLIATVLSKRLVMTELSLAVCQASLPPSLRRTS